MRRVVPDAEPVRAPVGSIFIGPQGRSAHRLARRVHQAGISLLGLLVLGTFITFGAMLTLRLYPTVSEYLMVKRAVVKARSDGTNPQAIRSAFDRAAAIDDISSITGKDLDIVPSPAGGYSVSFAYEKRIPLFGPVSLLLDYRGDAGSAPRDVR